MTHYELILRLSGIISMLIILLAIYKKSLCGEIIVILVIAICLFAGVCDSCAP